MHGLEKLFFRASSLSSLNTIKTFSFSYVRVIFEALSLDSSFKKGISKFFEFKNGQKKLEDMFSVLS